MMGSFCSIAFASTVPVVRPSSFAIIVIDLVPASFLSLVRSSSLHDCFQRAMSPSPTRKAPCPTRIVVEYAGEQRAQGVPLATRGVPSAPGVLAQTALVTARSAALELRVCAKPRTVLVGHHGLCRPTGKTPCRQGNPCAQKYSTLPKFCFGVFVCHLIPVRGAYRDRHERGVSRGGRRLHRRDWFRRAGNRERGHRAHDRCGQRTVKPCRPDARGLCVKSCGDGWGPTGSAHQLSARRRGQ